MFKLQWNAQLEDQYNNDGLRNNDGIRLKVSWSCSHREYIWLLIQKRKKHNTGYSHISESHSIPLLDYKTSWSSSWKMQHRPKVKQNAIVKWWIILKWWICYAESIATYWHIKYRTTNIKNKISIHCMTSFTVSILFKTF